MDTTARRYFRFFNFIECFQKVYSLIGGVHEQGMVMGAIELGKWSALGVYVILEDMTIVRLPLYTLYDIRY